MRNDLEDDMRISRLKKLQCQLCKEYLTTPIITCSKEHKVCMSCRLDYKNCRICKKKLSDTRNKEIEELVEKTEFPCRRREHGCFAFMKQSDLGTHERICIVKNQLRCPIETAAVGRCLWTGNHSTLKEHFLKEHTKKPTKPSGSCNSLLLNIPLTRGKLAHYEVIDVDDHMFLCIWEYGNTGKKYSIYFSVINLGDIDTVASQMQYDFIVREKDSDGMKKKPKKFQGKVIEIDEICRRFSPDICINIAISDLGKKGRRKKQIVDLIVQKP